MKTLKNILDLAMEFLKKNGVPRPRLVAETLLAHFLEKKRIELYMHFDRPMIEEELVPFRAALKRVVSGEPLEYVIGEVEFFDAKISITKDVLIPRQETEILLDHVVKNLDGSEKRALDLCTGSGCLAIGLKKARPEIEVVGVDLSEKALDVARQNSADVHWMHGNLTDPVKGQKFDLILCNPPYVTEGEYENLSPSVRDHEPKMALVSGPSGLEFYERLNQELPSILSPGAKVFFEIGTGQGERLIKIFSNPFWRDLKVEKDWAGHERFFFSSYFS